MIKPINLEALTKWVTAIPDDVKRDITSLAPMLQRLGYDPFAYPPNYGDPDNFVAENTVEIRNNEDYWRKRGQEIATMSKPPRNYGKMNSPNQSNPTPNQSNLDTYKESDDSKQDHIVGSQDQPNEGNNNMAADSG